MKSVIFVIALTIASFSLAVTTTSGQTAAKTAEDFYAKLAELKVRGLPDDQQLVALSPYLAEPIVARIKLDRKKQADFVKKHPEEKPPWIEGDLFSSLFEGPTSYEVGKSRVVSGATHVDVKLAFTGDGQTSNWTDTAILKKTGGKWKITNILYKGKWQFKNGSSLLNALK